MKKSDLHIGLVTDDSAINEFLYVHAELGVRPSKLSLHMDFDTDMFYEVVNAYSINIINTVTDLLEGAECVINNTRYFAFLSKSTYISFVVLNANDPENSEVTNVSFLFRNSETETVNTIVDSLEPIETQVSIDGIEYQNMVTLDNGTITLERFEISKIDHSNISYYYNDEVLEAANQTITEINSITKGITIVNGDRGVGKSSLINYLTTKITKNIIHVPTQIVEIFDTIDIHQFLKHNTDSVIVIDDFDLDLYQSTKIMNSIVQLVDGFRANCYNIQFILCSNFVTDFTILSNANNLLNTILVEDLTEIKSKKLSKFLKIKHQVGTNKLIHIIKGTQDNCKKEIGY